ncbi:HAD family hydrolase [Aestuariibius sp. 2305UL40-4]|uniref:HAD family hydrolase n=1 Tax=Aestuariibius violaceus TaxID=3234132 RepID=UPI00345E9970
MPYSALLFGSIGTLAETSDIQRRAFNATFDEAGLGWNWGETEYRELLKRPGGTRRIREYGEARGQEVDADALHASKVEHFERLVREEGITPRPGVKKMLETAKDQGMKCGFVTATGQRQIDLILGVLDGISADDFDYIGERGRVENSKPAPDIYLDALKALDLPAQSALAIEDTPESAEAALAAGIACIAFAGRDADGQDFPDGCIAAGDALDPTLLARPQAAE